MFVQVYGKMLAFFAGSRMLVRLRQKGRTVIQGATDRRQLEWMVFCYPPQKRTV